MMEEELLRVFLQSCRWPVSSCKGFTIWFHSLTIWSSNYPALRTVTSWIQFPTNILVGRAIGTHTRAATIDSMCCRAGCPRYRWEFAELWVLVATTCVDRQILASEIGRNHSPTWLDLTLDGMDVFQFQDGWVYRIFVLSLRLILSEEKVGHASNSERKTASLCAIFSGWNSEEVIPRWFSVFWRYHITYES